MKHFLTTICLLTLLTSFKQQVGINDVLSAIKGGNAAQMAKYFDNTVEINMPDKSSSFSKAQAELVMRDFFVNNPVKSFEAIHKGENAGSQYCIGNLFTKTGTFRITVFMKQKGDGQVLQELRFESR